MKKFKKILVMIMDTLAVEILVQVLGPVLWILTLPVRVVGLICNIEALKKPVEEACNSLEELKQYKRIHYSLMYLILKIRIDFCNKFGWAI